MRSNVLILKFYQFFENKSRIKNENNLKEKCLREMVLKKQDNTFFSQISQNFFIKKS